MTFEEYLHLQEKDEKELIKIWYGEEPIKYPPDVLTDELIDYDEGIQWNV